MIVFLTVKFFEASKRVVENFKDIMDLFYKAIGMKMNLEKSTLTLWGTHEHEMNYISQIFPFKLIDLDMGLKYLGFLLKPKMY
jgi:hypothetical protein